MPPGENWPDRDSTPNPEPLWPGQEPQTKPLWPGQTEFGLMPPKPIGQGPHFIPQTPPEKPPGAEQGTPWAKPAPPSYEFFPNEPPKPSTAPEVDPATASKSNQPKLFSYQPPEEAATNSQDEKQAQEFKPRVKPFNQDSKKKRPLGTNFGINNQDILGLAGYYLLVAKEILMDPKVFFAALDLKGGVGEPILFCCFIFLITSLAHAIAHVNLFAFFQAFVVSFLSVALGAFITNFAIKKLGGKNDFAATARVLAFSKATALFAWISLGPMPIGAILALGYGAYMNYLGLSRINPKLKKQTLIVIISLLSITGAIWRSGMP